MDPGHFSSEQKFEVFQRVKEEVQTLLGRLTSVSWKVTHEHQLTVSDAEKKIFLCKRRFVCFAGLICSTCESETARVYLPQTAKIQSKR